MNNINLFKETKQIVCKEDHTILDATAEAGVNHIHACGGQGKCSTCRVSIIEGIDNCTDRNSLENEIAAKLKFPKEIRLACQTKLKGDVSIRRMISDQLDMQLVVEQIKDSEEMVLGSEKALTIVFTDIVNYTVFADRFPPYDIVHVLNRYFRIMNTAITKHNGIISDVAGDGILAVFGLETGTGNSVNDALLALDEMNELLDQFNLYLKQNFNVQFGIRAGIHYGKVIVGPFNTGAMKKTAVIGDNVNMASRIETANKEFGTSMLLSKEAYAKVADIYPNYKQHKTHLKGKQGEFELFELLKK